MAKKPEGFAAFHKIAKRVVAAPKDKVEARIAQKKAESTSRPPKK